MENSRKETHGCIVATLKLYLPDGRETKASQSTLVGGANTKIPQVDLYRLNQYIQEAVQREQNLESKLLNVQKKVESVRNSSSASWQALVDEDRLLSRIDMLEKKLLYFSKPLSEDKLREEIMKLQNEKSQYQTSAKVALKKVYTERMEAIQKLSVIEKALCSTEDECSLIREQLAKSQNQSRETTERLDAMQNQMDIKVSDYEEKIFKKEQELKNLNSELNELQEKLTNFKVK
jgi:chromosome segregation ATPase